jgi:hypothetical protein
VIVAVTALEQARRFLKQQELLGTDRRGAIAPAPERRQCSYYEQWQEHRPERSMHRCS